MLTNYYGFLCSPLFKMRLYSWKHTSVEYETFRSHSLCHSEHLLCVTVPFSCALFMKWINETNETSRNHYRVSHWRESIKTKQDNELLKIISGYVLFSCSFTLPLNMTDAENETHSEDLPELQPLPITHFVNEKACSSQKQQEQPGLQKSLNNSF